MALIHASEEENRRGEEMMKQRELCRIGGRHCGEWGYKVLYQFLRELREGEATSHWVAKKPLGTFPPEGMSSQQGETIV